MRCREARQALLERGPGSARTVIDPVLRGHLDRCPDCTAEEQLETLLRRDLAALRDERPPAIDVRGAVMERVLQAGRIDRGEVPTRQLGWAALLAAVWVAALVGGLALILPDLPALFEGTRDLGRALGDVVTGLVPVLLTLLALPLKLAGVAIKMLGALAPLVGRLQPVGATAVGIACVAMALTIALVVGRDLRRGLPARIQRREIGS